MKPIKFPQANMELQKPLGWTDEECGPLPILTDGGKCLSLWHLSWRERLSALFFGKVWLWVYSGQTQPPVALMAYRDVFDRID